MHYHGYHLNFLANRELNELYASMAIRKFSLSIISIFIPIFLIKTGYSIPQVFLYYAIVNIAHAIFTIPAVKLAGLYGFKHIILFSIPFRLAFYALLYTIESHQLPLPLLGIIFGIEHALFWLGYHVDFATFSDRKKRGKEQATSRIIISTVSIIGPIFGGLILTYYNFNVLFIVTTTTLALSSIPLFLSRDIHKPINFSIKKLFKNQKIKDFLAFMGHGIEGATIDVIWPIFVFFGILNSYTELGAMHTFSFVFSILFVIIIGKLTDRDERKILRAGAIMNSLVWFIKYTTKSAFQVFAFESLQGMSTKLVGIPFNALDYDKADGNVLETIAFREFAINISAAVFLIIMIFITNLKVSFVLSGLGTLLNLLF